MGRPRKFDTRAVLAAARSEFQAKGYAATSCDDLMVATGLGKGSMYGAFGDKRQLFLSVLADYSSERLELVRQSLRAGG
ncbi:MAG TPA: helix-turn-helix domain-containing protein, partial [Polyangiaceae bacterium]|nr:helix-turn-helix domain-containing protein [Polyangiaceae bacterium]